MRIYFVFFFQGGKDAEQQKAMQDRARQQEDAKHSILSQIMDQNARARCKTKNINIYRLNVLTDDHIFSINFTVNTLKISKPEKAQMVEGMIIRMAQMGLLHSNCSLRIISLISFFSLCKLVAGQLQGKLDDPQLVQLLESVNSQMPRSTSSVKFDRRRAAIDSDSDDDDYGL